MNILEIQDLTKSFGDRKVLDKISLNVPEHTIFGFTGPNGAGKTTTMKLIMGMLKADQGKIRVGGKTVHYGKTDTNKLIGYLPDVPEFYGYMTPREYLQFCGEITGMSSGSAKMRGEELLELTGLKADERKRIGGFSRGMKQRLGIAQALLNQPRLLICDEPTSALDPVGRKEILDILERAKEHTTVVFSTHILSDVERICDQVSILNQGRIVLAGNLGEIKSSQKTNLLVTELDCPEDTRKVAAWCGKKEERSLEEQNGNTLQIKTNCIERTQRELIQLFWEEKITPVKMERIEPTLEKIFLEVVK